MQILHKFKDANKQKIGALIADAQTYKLDIPSEMRVRLGATARFLRWNWRS